MEEIEYFNIRIYGILIHDEKILLLKENHAKRMLTKFPGGGLEKGEGIRDCLAREFAEELNLEVIQIEHFYTQDFFLRSAFYEDEQLITHYYLVSVINIDALTVLDKNIEEVCWKSLHDLQVKDFSLPVDKIVAQKLINEEIKKVR